MSADQLLREASELSPSDLDQFVSKLIRLRAGRIAPHLPVREAELLRRINQGIPGPVQRRLEELAGKRDLATLSPAEHEELKRLSLQAEQIEAERIQDLSELASLRGTTLAELMEKLGLGAPA
jgi:hypothetical protein